MKLMDDEEVLLELQPEPKLLVIWCSKACLIMIAIIPFLILILTPMFPAFDGLLALFSELKSKLLVVVLPVVLGTFLLILVATFAYYFYLRRTYRYTITNRRCIFSGGILRRVRHSVPYHKITDVEMSQNIIERMLGISSLGIYTPGTGSMGTRGNGRRPEIAYVGLKDNEAPAEVILKVLSQFKSTGQ